MNPKKRSRFTPPAPGSGTLADGELDCDEKGGPFVYATDMPPAKSRLVRGQDGKLHTIPIPAPPGVSTEHADITAIRVYPTDPDLDLNGQVGLFYYSTGFPPVKLQLVRDPDGRLIAIPIPPPPAPGATG